MNIWNSLPRLAVGSHDRDSGKACIMNAIAYGQGYTEITDMPACTHPVLAEAAQRLNDIICSHHRTLGRITDPLLCAECSTVMYGYEPLLVGTAPPADRSLAAELSDALHDTEEAYEAAPPRAVLNALIDTYYTVMGREKPTVPEEHYVELRQALTEAGVGER